MDWAQVTRSYAYNFVQAGGKIHVNFPATKFQRATEGSEYPVLIFNDKGKVSTTFSIPIHIVIFTTHTTNAHLIKLKSLYYF